MIATTASRVSQHTPTDVQDRIARQTEQSLLFYREHPEAIPQRLAELDREWDIERVLETGSSALTLTGLVLGTAVSRKWLLLSLAVQGFFLQHALQGWCPPLPVFRRLGVRTADEIDGERRSLQALQRSSARGT